MKYDLVLLAWLTEEHHLKTMPELNYVFRVYVLSMMFLGVDLSFERYFSVPKQFSKRLQKPPESTSIVKILV